MSVWNWRRIQLDFCKDCELKKRAMELEEALKDALRELYAHRKRHYLDSPTPGPVERKIEAVLKGEYKNV